MDTRLKCQICKKTFTQKSSLIRHTKRCAPGPAPSLRQRSCRQCTNSKTKCDLRRPKCSRCEQRNVVCEYVIPMTRGTRLSSPAAKDGAVGVNKQLQYRRNRIPKAGMAHVSLEEAPPALLCTEADLNMDTPLTSFGFNLLIDKDPFADFQWSFPATANSLSASNTQFDFVPALTSSGTSPGSGDFTPDGSLLWSPEPSPTTPPLVRHSVQTLLRVVKTWPKMLAKNFQTPPMLHFTNTLPETMLQPMANCVTVAKMWAGQSDGTAGIVRQAVIQEIRSLFEQCRSMDERHLLSALQALAMYIVMLMFPGRGQISVSLVDPALFLCLRKFGSCVARTGMMLTEERDSGRPSWESWVHVTAKRRAVMSLYLLHWAYSVYHGLPSFECSQLGFMPAPAPKFLWQAETKDKWEGLYTRWLAQWGDCPYMMREFADIQSGVTLDRRTETWLEDADELGILFFSMGTNVHSCVEWW